MGGKDDRMTRRSFLGAAGAGALSLGLSGAAPAALAAAGGKKSRFRIAYLADVHVQPERSAAKWMEKCLEHAQSQEPDLIIYGGDMIMDATSVDKDRVKTQWDLFNRVNALNTGVPVKYVLGNHDIFGWSNKAVYRDDPSFGKRYALDVLQLERGFYSFEMGGWKIIVLDSVHAVDGNGYTARLDRTQLWWLIETLRKTPKTQPAMVVSHIPILSVTPYLFGEFSFHDNWAIPGAFMHTDARFIKDIFRHHPNVQLCLSGHMHMGDRVEYEGVTYLCNSAVSGNWWNGRFQDFWPSYTLVDLAPDGTFTSKAVAYGWKPA